MRTFVTALAVVACLGAVSCRCSKNEKPPAKETKQEPEPTQPAPERPSLETIDVTGPGLVATGKLGPKVTVGKRDIQLDGEVVMTIADDGVIDVERLSTLTRLLETKATSDAPIALELDQSLPYRRFGQLLDALKKAGFRNLALLTGTGTKMIPIQLADPAEANRGAVRPIVTVTQQRLLLWSATGEEGTKPKPKLSLELTDPPKLAPLTAALTEIVKRRWPDNKRADEDRTIIVQLDMNQSAQVMMQVLSAVRADGSFDLFPNIFLAGSR